MVLFFIATLLFLLIAILWIYARWEHGTLEKMGIPIVPYKNPLLGHIREIYEKIGPFQDIEWRKKYGKIFGVYEGSQAQVFICIPELVKQICVKDAEYFNSKRNIEFGDPIANEFPDFAPYEKWRAVRSMVTPTFTSAKLKLMNLPMKEASLDYIASLKKRIQAGDGTLEKLPIDTSVHAMLTDLILRCIFSVKMSGGPTENNEFADLIKQMLVPPSDVGMSQELIYYTHVFPFLKKILPSPVFQKGIMEKFIPVFNQLLNERRKCGRKFGDVFDIIVEWFDNLGCPEYEKAGITKYTLISQALVYFFASQDQVAMMISGVIYHMLEDPALEQKLLKEVDEVFKKHGKIEREHLKEFVHLEATILECTRLYPLFHRAERVCTKDWRSEEFNLEVKKGTVVMFPLWAINRDTEYTENAENFDAERFLPGNREKLNPYASTGFGHGPRNCTGMKFAMDMIQIVLVHLIKELKFVKRADTQLKFIPGGPFFVPHEPIYVDVKERN